MKKIPYPGSLVDRKTRNIIIDLVDRVNENSDLLEKLRESKPITEEVDIDFTRIKAPVEKPEGFSLEHNELSNKIYTDGKHFIVDYSVEDERKEFGKVYYVDQENGDNANGGNLPDDALSSLRVAYNKSDVGTIVVMGTNFRYNGLLLPGISKNINIIGYDKDSKIILADILNYTKESGYNNVYSAKRAGVGGVIDLSKKENGGYHAYEEVASIDEVDITPSSFTTSGGYVYVHHENEPNSKTLVTTLNSPNILIPSDGANYIYLDNIEIIGGLRPFRSESESAEIYCRNVKFLHGTALNGNGVEVVGGRKVILENCHASQNPLDGFNYHKGANGSLPYFVEINCAGNNNGKYRGTNGSRSDNGSTAHDGIKGIRINGVYANNDGGTIADVNEGTETWNLGVTAFNSLQGSDFLTSTGAKMWLDHCVSFGTSRSVNAINENDMVFTRNCTFKGTIAGNGQVTEY